MDGACIQRWLTIYNQPARQAGVLLAVDSSRRTDPHQLIQINWSAMRCCRWHYYPLNVPVRPARSRLPRANPRGALADCAYGSNPVFFCFFLVLPSAWGSRAAGLSTDGAAA